MARFRRFIFTAKKGSLLSPRGRLVESLSFLVFSEWALLDVVWFPTYSVLKYDMFSDCVLLHDSSSRFPAVRAENLSLTSQLTADCPGSTEKAQGLGYQEEKLIFFFTVICISYFPLSVFL